MLKEAFHLSFDWFYMPSNVGKQLKVGDGAFLIKTKFIHSSKSHKEQAGLCDLVKIYICHILLGP